jgi:hypothetical protein
MFYEIKLKNIKAFYTSLILLVIYLLIILNILNTKDNSIDTTTYNSSLEKKHYQYFR